MSFQILIELVEPGLLGQGLDLIGQFIGIDTRLVGWDNNQECNTLFLCILVTAPDVAAHYPQRLP